MEWAVIVTCALVGFISHLWGYSRGRVQGRRDYQRALDTALEALRIGYQAGRDER